MMRAFFGRLLQVGGMVVLPIGLYIGLFKGDVPTEVKLLAIGGAAFFAGWLLVRNEEK